MNSPFANLFLAIQDKLKNNLTSVVYIDQDLGQLKNARPAVSWPCVLIDFEDFEFTNLSENVQVATGTVVIRLAFPAHSPSAQATPSTYTQKALGYYDIEWDLHKLLQGWNPGSAFGKLCRTAVTTLKRTDNIRVREQRYSIAFEDYSTKITQQYAAATLVVQEQLDI